MLIIRKAQMAALGAYMQKQFEDRMVAHLRQAFPDQLTPMDDRDIRAMISQGIDKAESYGITDEVDVECYLERMVIYGTAFDQHPTFGWAREILESREIPSAQEMERIAHHELSQLSKTHHE